MAKSKRVITVPMRSYQSERRASLEPSWRIQPVKSKRLRTEEDYSAGSSEDKGPLPIGHVQDASMRSEERLDASVRSTFEGSEAESKDCGRGHMDETAQEDEERARSLCSILTKYTESNDPAFAHRLPMLECQLQGLEIDHLDYVMGNFLEDSITDTVALCCKLLDLHKPIGMKWIEEYRGVRLRLYRDDDLKWALLATSAFLKASAGDSLSDFERRCRLFVRLLRTAMYDAPRTTMKEVSETEQLLNEARDRGELALYAALDKDVDPDDVVRLSFLREFQNDLIDKHMDESQEIFCRGIAIVQSSGCGKSRLIRNVALSIPSFTIVLEGSIGKGSSIPQPDTTVCKFFLKTSSLCLGHVIAAAFVSALFDQLYVYIAADHYKQDSKRFEKARLFLNLCKKGFNSGNVLSTAREIKKTAKTYMTAVIRTKTLQEGVLEVLHKLRPLPSNEDRESFLRSVVTLAEALLDTDENKKTHLPTARSELKDRTSITTDTAYITRIGIVEAISDMFDLIDGASCASGSESIPPRTILTDVPESKKRPRQFILGLDECGYLDKLLGTSNLAGTEMETVVKKEGMEVVVRPQGLISFKRLIHDLEVLATEDRIPSKEAAAIRRVWLAMIDTRSEIMELMPRLQGDEAWHAYEIYLDESYREVNSVWHALGMNHKLMLYAKTYYEKHPEERRGNQAKPFFEKMTLSQMFSLLHLRQMGRGMWAAHHNFDTLMKLAMVKICLGLKDWMNFPIFDQSYRHENGKHLDQRTFAIASLRFNLDTSIFCQDGVNSFKVTEEAVAKHMRYLINFRGKHTVETCTPSEPILAYAALLLLNYGPSLLRSVGWVNGVNISSKGVWTDAPWKNMLKEVAYHFNKSADLVDIGDDGELLGRIVVTRARDCTLPRIWNVSEKLRVPLTTCRVFLSAMMGATEAAAILAKGSNSKLGDSLISFIQLHPYIEPMSLMQRRKVEETEPISGPRMVEAFQRCIACICYPDQTSADIIIPMWKMPEGASEFGKGELGIIVIVLKCSKDKDHDIPDIRPIEVQMADGSFVYKTPDIVIVLDLGSKGRSFKDTDKITDYILASEQTESPLMGQESGKEPRIFESDPFLFVRVRGMNQVFPCMRDIDPDGLFEKEARRTVAKRKRVQQGMKELREPIDFGPSDANEYDMDEDRDEADEGDDDGGGWGDHSDSDCDDKPLSEAQSSDEDASEDSCVSW